MTGSHSYRLARLETVTRRIIHHLDQYEGMTEEEAYRLRYGDERPSLRGVDVIIHVNPPDTPDGVPLDWALRREDPDYASWWEACRANLPPPVRPTHAD